ncbi:MAG: hypothetical protein JO112_04155 [Planctomycetes bacterium]|nr:hypothetical protein [Planctomycetota bacterium]
MNPRRTWMRWWWLGIPLVVGMVIGGRLTREGGWRPPLLAQEPARPDNQTRSPLNRPGIIVATDYHSLQEAIDAAKKANDSEVYIPAGTYVVQEPLNLALPKGYGGWLKITGAGPMNTKIVGKTHGKPVIDATGASTITMSELAIWAVGLAPAEKPNIGILLARRPDSTSSQEHRFTNVNLIGDFTLANVYNCTSEGDRFTGCRFSNDAPGSYNVMWTAENLAQVQSPYLGPIKSTESNVDFRFTGCLFYSKGGKGSSNIYVAGLANDLTVRDSCLIPSPQGYAVLLGTNSQGVPVNNALFESIRVEGEEAAAIFHVQGRAQNVTIRNSSIYFGEGPVLDSAEKDSLYQLRMSENVLNSMRGPRTVIQVGMLLNSVIDATDIHYQTRAGKKIFPGPPLAVQCTRSNGNYFRVQKRSEVQIGTSTADIIEAINDGPANNVARRYLGNFTSGTVLNLQPINTALIRDALRGDVALDNGTNTATRRMGFAVFDGNRWIYSN